MRNFTKAFGVAMASAGVALVATPAQAAGTQAGSTITNTVSVNYQVGGISQTAQSASNSITVDRKVNLTIASAASTTTVSPGQTSASTAFTVTNSSNDTIDIVLGVVNQSGGTAQHGGTDTIDVSNYKIYSDAALTTLITYLDEMAPDTTRTVYVSADVAISVTNGQIAGDILTGTAAAGGGTGSQGTVLTATSGANTAGVDTVFADGAGSSDAANDGKYSAKGDYTVSAPVLTVTKTSVLISDPVNGTTNPKAIPGAVMEYCIAVANAAGAATATSLTLSDPLPTTVTYSSGYGIFLNGTVTGATCNTDGTAGGTYTAGTTTVAGTLNNLTAGSTETLRFRTTIN
ncbi:hypothetical protein [Novosphingobium sp.]|uniref:hypothetical protein n=1 Tax=Novosphingobium sp. TaxID=1874826 RepID=UPI0025FFDE79|nr:hypothetical protein [Novosphingobium sp.]